MKSKICLFFIILITSGLYSQERDISALIKAIETGNIETAQAGLKKLKQSDPDDPSVIYLDALLTRDGKDALAKYERVAENYPHSRYADASLFRMYSYFYAAGLYNTAQKYYDKLEQDYPSSIYLKTHKELITEKELPKEDEENKGESSVNLPESHKEKSDPEKVFKYTIQAGAFLISANAQNLKNTFEKAGYYSQVKEKKVGGSTFSVVFLERFETEDEAKNFLIDLNKKQKFAGRVVRIE